MRVNFTAFSAIRVGEIYKGPGPYAVRAVTKIFYGWGTPVGVRFDAYKDDVPIGQSECSYADFERWATGQARWPERMGALSEWIEGLERDLVDNGPVYIVSERDLDHLKSKWVEFVSGGSEPSGSPRA